MQITIPYKPRSLQAKLHQNLEQYRWGVIVCHRRMGKTVMAINHLLRAAVLCPKKAPRYAYLAPTYRQAKAVAWDYLKQFAGGIPGIKFHETELRCDLPNGGRISLLGAENPDSLRGIYLDGCFMDEVADMPEKVFPEVIRPALSDREGFCYFVGTPKGQNAFFEMYEQATNNDDWYTAVHKASETAILNATELRSAKEAMTSDQYAQEYECSWVANVPGAIFGKELEAAMEEGRISRVPHDPTVKVDTFWDLGVGDSTAIWFVQSVGRAIHFIDCYENRGEGLPHYVSVLSKKNYLYGDHFAPHDIEVRELGSGKSRREIAWDLGLNFRVVPKLPLEDGLHAAQMLIPRSWFDAEKCKQGLVALRQYHRGYNERARSFRTTPVDDWSSDFADALRYTAVGIKETVKSGRPPQIHAEMDYNPFQQVGV